MLVPIVLALSLQAGPYEFIELPARFPEEGIVFVQLADEAGKARWLLLDSGSTASFVREKRGTKLGFDNGPGIHVDFEMAPSPRDYNWKDLDEVGGDGVLGIDRLRHAVWMIDYRREKVALWLGKPSLKKSVAPEFLRAMGRPVAPILSLHLTRDTKGWYRTNVRLGAGTPLSYVFDTGANSLFVGAEVPGLGAAVDRSDVSDSWKVASHAFHLVDLRLPGVPRALPVLAGASQDRRSPPVLGPDVLTDDWLLFDPIDNLVSFPMPTPAAFAARLADELTGGVRRVNRAQLAAFADVGTPSGLKRARTLAGTIVAQERRREATRVKAGN